MEKLIIKLIKNYKTKTFSLLDLETKLIKKLSSTEKYYDLGGYNKLVNVINKLKNDGEIVEIKSSDYIKRNPKVKSKWKKINLVENNWSDFVFLKYSDLLDLSFYRRNINHQNNFELDKIKVIYNFIKNNKYRNFVSYEERCLELFNDEKFYKKKNNVLSNLKLNSNLDFLDIYDALKIRKEIDELVWFSATDEFENVLILENKASFYSYKRILESKQFIGQEKIDALIFGNGKAIINKGDKIKSLINNRKVNIYYLGDIDPEGLGIYFLLCNKNINLEIELMMSFYLKMLDGNKTFKYNTNQNKNIIYLEYFIKQFNNNYKTKIKYLWNNNLRIPQELISYEVIK